MNRDRFYDPDHAVERLDREGDLGRPCEPAATSGWRTPAAASVSPPSSALIATAQGTGSTREKDYCRV
jgi:hypothetical protein